MYFPMAVLIILIKKSVMKSYPDLDKTLELAEARRAKMIERAEATNAFYAQLTPAQQAVFDAEANSRAWPRSSANPDLSAASKNVGLPMFFDACRLRLIFLRRTKLRHLSPRCTFMGLFSH